MKGKNRMCECREKEENKNSYSRFYRVRQISFVFLLVFGVVIFLIVTNCVKIPVYTPVTTEVDTEKNCILVATAGIQIEQDSPIYLYVSRDEKIEKITTYETDLLNSCIEIYGSEFQGKEDVTADVQTGQMTLLKYILSNQMEVK